MTAAASIAFFDVFVCFRLYKLQLVPLTSRLQVLRFAVLGTLQALQPSRSLLLTLLPFHLSQERKTGTAAEDCAVRLSCVMSLDDTLVVVLKAS